MNHISGSTEEAAITDPDGEVQATFVGLNQELAEQEDYLNIDNIDGDGYQDNGVWFRPEPHDDHKTTNLYLGTPDAVHNAYLGLVAEDPASGEVRFSEMLKHPGGQTILENDFQDHATVLENKTVEG